MNKIMHILLLAVCGALAACVSGVPLADANADAQAKLFSANPNVGRVYIFEAFAPISTHNIPVVVGTQIVGQLSKGTFMALDLKPRSYLFTSVGGANNPPLNLDVRPDQIYFLRMKQLFGMGYLGGAEYFPVGKTEGETEVASRKRVPAQTPPIE